MLQVGIAPGKDSLFEFLYNSVTQLQMLLVGITPGKDSLFDLLYNLFWTTSFSRVLFKIAKFPGYLSIFPSVHQKNDDLPKGLIYLLLFPLFLLLRPIFQMTALTRYHILMNFKKILGYLDFNLTYRPNIVKTILTYFSFSQASSTSFNTSQEDRTHTSNLIKFS